MRRCLVFGLLRRENHAGVGRVLPRHRDRAAGDRVSAPRPVREPEHRHRQQRRLCADLAGWALRRSLSRAFVGARMAARASLRERRRPRDQKDLRVRLKPNERFVIRLRRPCETLKRGLGQFFQPLSPLGSDFLSCTNRAIRPGSTPMLVPRAVMRAGTPLCIYGARLLYHSRMSDPAVLTRSPAGDALYLAALNDAQRRAIEAVDGPVLVLAGAGTGKTRVLTARLAHILATRRAFPSELLAVTFTNKAAREMRERLEAMIGRAADGVWLGTFHAIAARILRRHAEAVGLKSSFTILDTDDQIRLLKQILHAEDIDERRWPARVLLSVIQRWKDRGLGPDKVSRTDADSFADGRAITLYERYQERLATVNAVDFGDLLLHNLSLFTGHPDILAEYHRRFRYVLVDEYQDTNVAQYLWLRLLAQARRNLCCVGDDDQSIYSWRGAEIGNILRFESDFPGATIIRLEENYRSTSRILGAAAGMIAHNRGRLGKTLWTQAGEGDKIVVRAVWDAEEEARWVGDEIEALQRKGHALSQIAILVRAGFQTREI